MSSILGVHRKSLIYKGKMQGKILGEISKDHFCTGKWYRDQKNSPEIFWETPWKKVPFDTL